MLIDKEILNRLTSNDPKLTHINLSEKQLTDDDISQLANALSQNTALKYLELSNTGISDDKAELLAKNSNVAALGLSHNDISDRGAIALASNNKLKYLDLSGNDIKDEGAIVLASSDSLIELDLSLQMGDSDYNNGVSIGTKAAKALSQNKILRELNIGGGAHEIGDEGAIAFAQNTTLKKLSVQGNNISTEGAVALAQNSNIVSLEIWANPINDKGIIALAYNRNLKKLSLGGNTIGLKALEALSRNTSLIELEVVRADINDEGAKILAANHTLKKLNISYNNLTDIGASSFYEALETNISLTQLTFYLYLANRSENSISDKMLQMINLRLERNQKIDNENNPINKANLLGQDTKIYYAPTLLEIGVFAAKQYIDRKIIPEEYAHQLSEDLKQKLGL